MSLFKNQGLTVRNQNPISSWQKELNNLFDRFGRDLGSFDTDLAGSSIKVEIKEKNKPNKY